MKYTDDELLKCEKGCLGYSTDRDWARSRAEIQGTFWRDLAISCSLRAICKMSHGRRASYACAVF